jgi:hypothetical protein
LLAGLTLYARRRSNMSGDLMVDDTQRPTVGSRVELSQHKYGHVAGAQGVVVRGAPKGNLVLVCFDDTGYRISVPREALKSLA